jgi:hypothetical protein
MAAPNMRAMASASGSTPPPPAHGGFIASFPSTAPAANAICTTIRAACVRKTAPHDDRLAMSARSGKDMRVDGHQATATAVRC